MGVTRVTVSRIIKLNCLFLFMCYSQISQALVLPEDRADALFHSYSGGGVTVDGPSVLVRKSIGDSVSVSGNYYVDNISGASIDVQLGASAYTEKREQLSASVDLYDKSIMSYSYTSSVESDFDATTQNISMTQEMFGGLTTINMGFTLGDNIVGKNDDDTFSERAVSRGYRLSLSQVLTKNMIMSLAYEIITDEGFLNNPYRSVRYDNSVASDPINPFLLEPELYPNTRTSNAAAVAFKYYLPYRAAATIGYRAFTDTWQISANTIDIGYTHPIDDKWLIEFDYRFYTQTRAVFYSDLFDFAGQFDFRARDKELSTYIYHSLGLGVSYEFGGDEDSWFEKGSVNFNYNFIAFKYDDFLDARASTLTTLGQESEYSFNAGVLRLFVSVWF